MVCRRRSAAVTNFLARDHPEVHGNFAPIPSFYFTFFEADISTCD